MKKLCPKCGRDLLLAEFSKHKGRKDGLSVNCKDCERERARLRTAEQRQEARRREAEKLGKDYKTAEEIKALRSAQRAAKKEENKRLNENKKPWQLSSLSHAEQRRMRYKLDPEFNLKERLRRQLNKQKKKDKYADLMRTAINKGGRSPLVAKTFGYSIRELKQHLESKFVDGMNWKAFMNGEIHMDHIKPVAVHDLTDHNEFIECWSLSNIQPLWARDNLKKSATWQEKAA